MCFQNPVVGQASDTHFHSKRNGKGGRDDASQARPKLRAKSMESYTLKNNHLQLDALPYTPTGAAVLTSRSFSVSKSVLVWVLQRQRAIEGERERENIEKLSASWRYREANDVVPGWVPRPENQGNQ